MSIQSTATSRIFKVRTLRDREPWDTPLELNWEVSGDPISDDYTPDEISAEELYSLWREKYVPPHGWVTIHWQVRGNGIFEAFFDGDAGPSMDDGNGFFRYFRIESEINWLTDVPVLDKLWTPTRADKGGFIQSTLGWKPSALQTLAHIPTLESAAFGGVRILEPLPPEGYRFYSIVRLRERDEFESEEE